MPKTDVIDAGRKASRRNGKAVTPKEFVIVRQVTASELTTYWDVLAESIMKAFGDDYPHKHEMRTRIMAAIAAGAMQCWVILSRDKPVKLLGTCTTKLVKDNLGGELKLFIYSLHSARATKIEAWKEAYKVLEDFARKENCTGVMAVTHNPRVIEIARNIGMNVRFMLEKGV